MIFALVIAAPLANASKSIIASFGSRGNNTEAQSRGGRFNNPKGVAVNYASGDIYVADSGKNRIQRFDSSHNFISAWGVDVIGGNAETGFEICTVAATCKVGVTTAIGGVNPGGQLNSPQGIAINQSTGDVYVINQNLLRVDEFSANGEFIRAFGQDVVQAGKPGDLGANVFEVCTVAADCKTGVSASTAGAFASLSQTSLTIAPAGAPNAGDVLVADPGNRRVSEYTSTGAFIRSFGFDVVESGPDDSGTSFEICKAEVDACQAGAAGATIGQFANNTPLGVAENSTGVIYTTESREPNFRVQRFTPSGSGLTPSLLAVNDEVQAVTVNAAAGQFKLTLARGVAESTTADLPFNASAAEIQSALNALATVNTGGGSVTVSGGPGNASGSSPYVITFDGGPLAGADAAQITADDGATPLSGGSGAGANEATVATMTQGAPGGTEELTAPTNIAIDASENIVLNKRYLPGSTPNCLNTNAASVQEDRVLEITAAGALLATHLACAGNPFPSGLALNPTIGRIYFSSTFPVNTAEVYVLGDVTPPTATIDPVAEFDAFSAALRGHADPQGSLTECRFDYIAKAAFEQNLGEGKEAFAGAAKAPCDSNPGAGTGSISVSAQIKGTLTPSTPYKVRLVAFKPPFGDVATASPIEEFTTAAEPPPTVITGAVAPRGTTTARLNGLVNPNGSATEVHFEYGTAGPCSANPCESTPAQDVGSTYIPPDKPFTAVTADLEELEPGMTYFYRLVGVNGIGTSAGADRTFTTLAVEAAGNCPNEEVRQRQHTDSYLGSCRAIELVNAPDKGNQDVTAEMMTQDGERVLWSVRGGAPGGTASAGNSFLAERTAAGWGSRNLVPPAAQQFGEANLPYKAENATPDLGTFVFNAGNPSIALAHGKTLIRLDREQHQEVLASYENEVIGSNSEISDGGAHVLVVDPDTRQLEDIGNLQEAPETISLIPPPGSPLGVPQPGGTPSACGLSTTGESFAGWSTGSAAGAHWNPGYRMMAVGDASRVYFETRPDGNCGGSYGLYERNRETDTTTLIDPGTPSRNVEFIRATPDGRSAYFATFSQLDPADQNTGADVYRWDEEAAPGQRYTCLTCVVPNADIAFFNGGLLPIMVSDDFSHVYFQSRAQLVPGQGQAGSLHTYALSGGEIRFVAGEGVGRMGVSGGNAGKPGALLSSDGNVLVFRSTGGGAEGLTADSVPGQCLVFGELGPCQELYRYDDRDGSLECISCRHDGETTASVIPAFKFAMSADGSTVAFVTTEPLVARDVNQGLDVYEWRNGTVHLISDGVRSFQLSFARPEVSGIDADGKNIFFAIVAPGLTGFEQDGLRNLYDARIGGGFLPPSPPAHCAEDSCQGSLQSPPALPAPASANESAGNVAESHGRRPCARKHGKAKRRCMRSHRRKASANRHVGRTR